MHVDDQNVCGVEVADGAHHAVARSPARVGEAEVAHAVLRSDLADAALDAQLNLLSSDEGLDVASGLGEILGARRRGIALHGAVDHGLRQARIEVAASPDISHYSW